MIVYEFLTINFKIYFSYNFFIFLSLSQNTYGALLSYRAWDGIDFVLKNETCDKANFISNNVTRDKGKLIYSDPI